MEPVAIGLVLVLQSMGTLLLWVQYLMMIMEMVVGQPTFTRVFHQDPGTKVWIMQQKLVADDGAIDDHFGGSVAIFGDTLVVGAHWDGERDMIVGQHTSTTKTP